MPALNDAVRVVYRKYDESLHWHQWMTHLGDDEHGRWLGAPAGTPAQRGDEPPVLFDEAQVMLLPRDRWWTAAFYSAPREVEVYCDITTPVEFSDDLVTMVDLDLDVLRLRDGSMLVDDEDEFAEHQVRYGYPADVVAEAQRSCDWLASNITTAEPFLTAYRPYLDRMA